MRFDCEAARDHIDAYALGALDADEKRALETHLSACADCQRRVDDAREVAASLALTVPLVSSGPALKARIIASASVLRDVRTPPARRWWPAAAAALVVLSIGGFTWGALAQKHANDNGATASALRGGATAQSSDFATVRTQLVQMSSLNQQLDSTVRLQDDIDDIVAQPDLQRIPMNGTSLAASASARYLWSPSSAMGALVTAKLPKLSSDKQYEMWVVYKDRWVPGGSFSVDDTGRGRLVVRRTDEAAGGDRPLWFCVTVEPAGGTLQASGQMVLRSVSQ